MGGEKSCCQHEKRRRGSRRINSFHVQKSVSNFDKYFVVEVNSRVAVELKNVVTVVSFLIIILFLSFVLFDISTWCNPVLSVVIISASLLLLLFFSCSRPP